MQKPGTILLWLALVFCAALALYLPAAPGELLWDDGAFIGHNRFAGDCSNLQTALNPVYLFKILPVPMSARPVVNATLIADACYGGGLARMHLTNALLHAFNSVLVLLLILTLSGAGPPALFGALVFALHPASAETVNIITFRSHLLGFFFFAAGLLAAILHSREKKASTAAAAAACYLLAMLSVETAIILPAAVLLAVYFEKDRDGLKKVMPLMCALAALAVFYLWFRTPRSGYAMEGISSPGLSGASSLYPRFLFPPESPETPQYYTVLPWRLIYDSLPARIYTMGRIAADYFAALIVPLRLNTDYNPAVITSAGAGLWPLAADLAVAAGAGILLMRKRLAGLGLALMLAGLLPALNIWPIYNIKADRYLYLPLAGFALAAAAAFGRIRLFTGARKHWLTTAAWLWLGALAAVCAARIPEFKDNLSFFSAAVRKGPTVPRARVNLAAMYMRSDNCTEAVTQLREAAKIDPQNYQLELRLAFMLTYCGQKAEALEKTGSVLLKKPEDAEALYLAGLLRLKSDKRAAMVFFRRALAADPNHLETRLTLILAEKGGATALSPQDSCTLKSLKKLYTKIGVY